ncbi:type II toxin-antitoxin system HipA family toxin [Pseudolysobacter antarcticus]|uniref:Type II toxin-antitoxin system HipA family toxin n=1 Tax=Pseudolysobacter antarcticus TaxID=2511995 RepID=A0A411HJV9_9GAMM|nr:HipA domain-containing protein [Pseudolysobacter antarcticus]QBB70667.1 type II toxin-antitoxin system HipA family toxin [Pseudolysobacter antarcticus]
MSGDFIAVYADWDGLLQPLLLGRCYTHRTAGREVFDFEFDATFLRRAGSANLVLDPGLGLFEGRQYPVQGQETFGAFADASPDRWGRMLMRRRLERAQRAGQVDVKFRLHESDYLLGVHDNYRVGALRFRRNDEGPFLDDQHDVAAPPFVQLRALEAASLALERDENNTDSDADEWLRMLVAPGGSLGGARPKASVVDPQGHLWIAKFPSVRDEYDVGAWEMLVHTLARACGLTVPGALLRRFGSHQHTFLIKRFDRTSVGRRLHFASAMNLTGHQDGDDANTGASYLEIARVLMTDGSRTDADLRELWSRIVFSLLVSNSDDHLRNHGFLLEPGTGWRLSPAFDINPVPFAHGLKLNISAADNALDLDLARSVAQYFRVSAAAANEIIEQQQQIVAQWRTIADAIGIPASEQRRLASAFLLAEAGVK